MNTENISKEEKQNTFLVEQVYCSSDVTAAIQGQLIFVSAFNVFLSITAFLGNALILVALRKESSLHPPSKLLLRCRATTDLCVGLIVDPLYVTLLVIVVNDQWNICFAVAAAVSIAGFSLCTVSVDPDCNERGQTSRPVVEAEIQTSCNTEASLLGHYYLLRCVECLFNDNDVLEFPYRLRVCYDSYLTLSCKLDLLLHEDFLHPPSSSKPTARPRSATEPNK